MWANRRGMNSIVIRKKGKGIWGKELEGDGEPKVSCPTTQRYDAYAYAATPLCQFDDWRMHMRRMIWVWMTKCSDKNCSSPSWSGITGALPRRFS